MAIDKARAERRQESPYEAELAELVADETPLMERVLLDREMLEQVRSAIEELSPRCREVLHLRRIVGLSAAEIAVRLGISRQMVTRYVAQAMEHCLNRIEGDGPA